MSRDLNCFLRQAVKTSIDQSNDKLFLRVCSVMFCGSQPQTFSLLFAVFDLHWNYIKTGHTSGCLPHLPGGLQNRRPPLCPFKCHKNWSSSQVQKGNLLILCIMLLNTFKILFVLICLLCFDSRKAGGEYTGFLPITALNSNTIKYTVRSHVFQVTDQFCFNLVCLIYHTSWSVSLKKYVERLLFSADSCLQFMP